MDIVVPFQKVSPESREPTFREGDVGFDLYADREVTLAPMGVTRVPTGIKLAGYVKYGVVTERKGGKWVPETAPAAVSFFKIEGRSGKASNAIFPIGGIIDPSFRGEIVAIMVNMTPEPVIVKAGEKFAQMVMYQAVAPSHKFRVKFKESRMEPTDRGDGGFGSSGD